jgi:hypothetical protein
VSIALAGIGLAVLWIFGGAHDATGALLSKVLVTGAVVLLFPIVFVWKLVTVPARMAAEAAKAVEELRAKLNKREVLQRGLDLLGSMLIVARQLINVEVTNEEEFGFFIANVNRWRSQTHECIAETISLAEARSFDVALGASSADWLGSFNKEHSIARTRIDQRAERLRQLIARYSPLAHGNG